MDWNSVVTGIRLSIQEPRFHPASMPRIVPNTKARIVEMPTRPTVHGRVLPITEDTEFGK